jgi:signal transduction histidine kinase
MQDTELFDIAQEIVQTQKQIFPDIYFNIANFSLKAKINPKAMMQILQNIISNACKYNSKDGSVKIYAKENRLYVEDSGKGIKNPQKIFDRSFSEKNSSGIGLDIVKRLAQSMSISIEVKSSSEGCIFILTMG